MKNKGKITLITIALLMVITGAVWITQGRIEPAKAESIDNSRLCFPVPASMAVTSVDDLYVIFVDRSTGYMAHKTTGTTAVNTSWGNAAVEGASQATTDAGGTNTRYFVCNPPPLDPAGKWDMAVFENGTPANTDVAIVIMKYDPTENEFFGGTNPIRTKAGGARIRVDSY